MAGCRRNVLGCPFFFGCNAILADCFTSLKFGGGISNWMYEVVKFIREGESGVWFD